MKIPKKCWYCGAEKMAPDKRGASCAACGATWSPALVVHRSPLEIIDDGVNPVSYSPSKTLTRSTAASRGKLWDKDAPE